LVILDRTSFSRILDMTGKRQHENEHTVT